MDDYLWNKVISFYQHRTALMIKKHIKEWKDSNDRNGFDSNDRSFFYNCPSILNECYPKNRINRND